MRRVIGRLGDIGQVVLPLSAGLQALSLRDYRGFCLLTVATVINQICIEILKNVTAVKRPNGREGSFPSGHTAAAFLSMSFIVCRYGATEMPWTVFIYAVLCSMVGASRVITNNHWASDTVGGFFLAMSVTALLVSKKEPPCFL